MSIPPISSSTPPFGAPAAAPVSRPATTSPSAFARTLDAASVDTMPASPPPEVQAAMATAADVGERLAASGQTLRFGVDSSSGRIAATLADSTGVVRHTLTGSQVLALAEGGPIG